MSNVQSVFSRLSEFAAEVPMGLLRAACGAISSPGDVSGWVSRDSGVKWDVVEGPAMVPDISNSSSTGVPRCLDHQDVRAEEN